LQAFEARSDAIQMNQTTSDKPQCWIDLGSGTGYLSKLVEQKFHQSVSTIRLDIAIGMLQTDDASLKINADAESLPLQNDVADSIISSMALQWVSSPLQCARELARVMKSGATASLAILRSDSLPELHAAWEYLGQGRRVNQFYTTEHWSEAFSSAKLTTQGCHNKAFVTHHASASAVLHSIKDIGAGQTRVSHPRTITRSDLRDLNHWWQENCDCSEGFPLTYKVDFWQLSK
jgi:malonyl-CoA O-methyltransferase